MTGKKKPHIIRVDFSKNFQAAMKSAADLLLSGGVVAYPTESFYGLAVDITNEKAIKRLFQVKKRETGKPVLILVPSVAMLEQYVERVPPVAHQLIEAFWPGGLTLVFEAGARVSPLLTANSAKIGIRLSSHPVATALSRTSGIPISGTSANISGEPPNRNAQEVSDSLGEAIDLILDGGETAGEVGSTVLDVTGPLPRILREGMITKGKMEERLKIKILV